ncbi:MAG: hypothetical protein ACC656_00860, partial [Candidatus Heimdallarchaeota archaeon]
MNKEFIRPDGRKADEMRNVEVEVGILTRADGSARVRLGNNLVIASVYGPREMHPKHSSRPDRANVRLNYRMATFSVKDYKRSFPSRREKEISKVLSEAFESIVLTKMFPRSVIDIHVQIFESDGGTRTAAAIAASAALADAGIPMRDLTGGIASGLYENMVCLDLNGLEDNVGSGDMPILYSPNIDEISLFQLDGQFTFEQFKKSFNYSLEGIKTIVDKIKLALKQKYVRVRDELALDDDEEEIETQYSSIEEDQETIPSILDTDDEVTDTLEIQEEPIPVDTQLQEVTEGRVDNSVESEPVEVSNNNEEISEASVNSDAESDITTEVEEVDRKTVSEMLAEEVDSSAVKTDLGDLDETPEFDRSVLKPMGGIIQKIASSEEENPDASEGSEENLKDLYKKIKSDDDQESSNDIM